MNMVRKGWKRLGIALTVTWLALVAGYAAYEWQFGFAPTCIFLDGYPDTRAFHQGTANDPIPLIRVFRTTRFLAVAVAPITGIWMVVLVVMPTARWIHE